MEKYFEQKECIGGSDEAVMKKIAYRYMRDNPIEPFAYRAFNTLGFIRDDDGRCILDFDEKFPNAQNGDYAYAVSKLYSEKDGICTLSISCKNPCEVYINGKLVTSTTIYDEVLYERRKFDFEVRRGYNIIFIKNKKNALGFKCIIGSFSPKWRPVNFYTAFAENEGELGWNYCGCFKSDVINVIAEENSHITDGWLPKPESNTVFSTDKNMYAVSFMRCEADSVEINCNCDEEFNFFVDGKKVFSGVGNMTQRLNIAKGIHSISTELKKAPSRFDISLKEGEVFLPNYIHGVRGNLLFVETNDNRARNGFDEFLLYGSDDKEYFKSTENSYIRPVLERPIFGKSNYPIGVALYGLLKAGKLLDDSNIINYAHNHLLRCCLIQNYAEYDSEKFGSACVNHQLLNLSALDDCGSFASAILEDYLNFIKDERVLPAVDYVGNYIRFCQERLENGAFYREKKGEFHQYTVWADDLYMGTLFLMRYSVLKNDSSILDDAINQFIQFKKLLFMQESKFMSHVYNLKYDKKTCVPWGRGNGWALFSLSELLRFIPYEHECYHEIKSFFIELSEGFLNVMDGDGMCHQVLDDKESYGEASCTAMCAAAFARGVMLGLLPKPYAEAAKKAVDALRKYCIDEDGNIYGVCIGSGYSFTREYYKYNLRWNINDTHGTGIVLIAIEEVHRMKNVLNAETYQTLKVFNKNNKEEE